MCCRSEHQNTQFKERLAGGLDTTPQYPAYKKTQRNNVVVKVYISHTINVPREHSPENAEVPGLASHKLLWNKESDQRERRLYSENQHQSPKKAYCEHAPDNRATKDGK